MRIAHNAGPVGRSRTLRQPELCATAGCPGPAVRPHGRANAARQGCPILTAIDPPKMPPGLIVALDAKGPLN